METYAAARKKNGTAHMAMPFSISFLFIAGTYIIPPMPPAPAGIAGVSSLIFATTLSVVSRVLATLVAFCNALLVTLVGSRMPALTKIGRASCRERVFYSV